jgi:hypothetical protein
MDHGPTLTPPEIDKEKTPNHGKQPPPPEGCIGDPGDLFNESFHASRYNKVWNPLQEKDDTQYAQEVPHGPSLSLCI